MVLNIQKFININHFDWSQSIHEILLIESKNQSNIFNHLSRYLIEEKFIKTDLVNLARVNREKTTFAKYDLIKDFNNRNLSVFNKKIFLTKNKNIASYLKHLFQNEIYIYFQDKIWIISNEKIGEYPQYDLTLETFVNLNEKNNFLINFDHASQVPS